MENERAERLRAALKVQRRVQDIGLQIVESDPWVPIKFGDAEYKLEYSYGAVKELFRKTGKVINLHEITDANMDDDDFFLSLLLAGLRTHHKDTFPDEESLSYELRVKHRTYYKTCVKLAIQATEPDREKILEILSENEEKQIPLPLDSTSSGSGVNVEILDAPKVN